MTITNDEIKAIGAIDLMLGIPTGDPKRWYEFLRKQLLDRESREDFEFPAQYMFKNVPHFEENMDDPVSYVLAQMDHHGIAKAMLGASFRNEETQSTIQAHPDRFFGCYAVNPSPNCTTAKLNSNWQAQGPPATRSRHACEKQCRMPRPT